MIKQRCLDFLQLIIIQTFYCKNHIPIFTPNNITRIDFKNLVSRSQKSKVANLSAMLSRIQYLVFSFKFLFSRKSGKGAKSIMFGKYYPVSSPVSSFPYPAFSFTQNSQGSKVANVSGMLSRI